MQAKSAKYDLNEVFAYIRRQKYWFSAKSRSVDEVTRVYAATSNPKSAEEAERFILDGIFALTPSNFYDRGFQWEMTVDIYGLIYDNRPWFVKFGMDEQEDENGTKEKLLQEISFHPPECGFVTQGGINIPAGGP